MTSDALLDGRLKLRHIRIVLAIAECGTLIRAAEALYVTQPVVTRALSEIEDILGAELFTRGPKGVAPTEFGREFLRDAAVVAARLRDVQRRIELRTRGQRGHLIIGNHLSGSTTVLPQAVAALKMQCPEATVTLREAAPDQLVELLRAGAVDVVVGRLSEQFFDADFVLEELFREPVRVVARAGHPLASAERLELHELRDEAWILPLPQTSLRREVERCFAQARVPVPVNLVECTSATIMRAIVSVGDTIAVMPDLVAATDPGLRILPVRLKVERSVGVITHAARERSPLSERFLTELRLQSRCGETATVDEPAETPG
ncbi:LysR substrate-binding domain-containing protein [Leucobacter triazinivorans]|uniref:LysR family transcriptional regulator n=1 Tax=Leucobacter triazinivorans TaxID=1784719 RepID=A0A4P6KDJ6_9MICO|nr:LysR substrate-binding domain-containing protein [Leucobacter triazinivorans]QBE47958.1 LysR family transcriptional regulator [Leucobacter triazinivorans]